MWLSALGLALFLGGLAVGGALGPAWEREAVSGSPSTAPSTGSLALPFVVEPEVTFRSAPTAPPTTNEPAPGQGDGPSPSGRAPGAGTPVRLVIPGLGVDAPVIGIATEGSVLVPPSDPQTLGWWTGGARPGAGEGGALITGHTVSTGGGAFDDLETLRRGDRLSVRTVNGQVGYRVTGVTIYRKASLAQDAERLFSQDVPGRLVLVTCEDWTGEVYLSNVVVFAEPLRR